MIKKILCLFMFIVTLILTGCGESRTAREVEESTTEVHTPSEFYGAIELTGGIADELLDLKVCSITENEETPEGLYDWQIELTEEMFQSLPDVPDWNSTDAYIQFLKGFKPSDEILKIYNRKKDMDELLSGYLHLFYQGEDINYIPPYYDGKFYSSAMFKQNNCLVRGYQDFDRTIQMIYSDGHSEEVKLDIIPEGCTLLTTVSVHEDRYSNFLQGFSICYDKENSEIVCVRFDEEIGERVKISSEDIEELFFNKEETIETDDSFLSIGYINHNNEMVYPTIIEDETGIRFELIKEALKDPEEQLIYFSSAIIDDINFKAYNNNVYIIDNVKRRIGFEVEKGYFYGIWTTSGEAKMQEIPIVYSELQDVQILVYDYHRKNELEVCASIGNMTIFGKDTYMYQGQFKNQKFRSYLFDEGHVMGLMSGSTSLSLQYDNWKEAETTIIQLKKYVIE